MSLFLASVWVFVWLTVSLAATALLLAGGIALARHALLLYRSLQRFQDEIGPIAEDIAEQQHRVSEAGARMRTRDLRRTSRG